MILKWFKADEAAEVGTALADQFASASDSNPAAQSANSVQVKPVKAIQQLLRSADSAASKLQLNFYKKAKLANSFKWRLIEKGVNPEIANEVTQSLVMHISQKAAEAALSLDSAEAPAAQPVSRKAHDLLGPADKSFAEGNYEEAAKLYAEFVEIFPRRPEVLNTLGVALSRLNRYREAEKRYREAIKIKPDFADALCNLATLLQDDPLEAEEWIRRALKVNPKYPGARSKLGIILAFKGEMNEAKAAFRKAIKIAPRDSDALLGLGQIARAEGQFDEAKLLIQRALKINPQLPSAWAALNSMGKMTLSDGDWLKRADEIAGSGISLWGEVDLRFAMGKYCDDVEDFDRAFQNYRRGNELLKTVAKPYDRTAHSGFVDNMIREYTQESIAADARGGSASTKPILVLGMPRSGTSLTEQIIASHPAAKGAGEPDFWLSAERSQHIELSKRTLDEADRKKLGEEYLLVLERRCPESPRIVDKTPVNSDYLGLIHSVLPNSRIIRMRRDPIDTCLSCYFQRFSTAMTFTMDLSDLTHYFREHERLMSHWCDALPSGTILEVPYEGLVADQETWTRKILDFLGLDWDERCLNFQETKRTVNTASSWQVRQKMYQQSVGRWRNYQKFIGPLKTLKS